MTSLKTSIKTITYLSDIGCLEIQGASLLKLRVAELPTEEKPKSNTISFNDLVPERQGDDD